MGLELGVTDSELLTTSFSIFMLGVGVSSISFPPSSRVDLQLTFRSFSGPPLQAGPFVFSPLSEIYGRKPMYTSTMVIFTFINIGCALAPKSVLRSLPLADPSRYGGLF